MEKGDHPPLLLLDVHAMRSSEDPAADRTENRPIFPFGKDLRIEELGLAVDPPIPALIKRVEQFAERLRLP